jgi:hypothetical protein
MVLKNEKYPMRRTYHKNEGFRVPQDMVAIS